MAGSILTQLKYALRDLRKFRTRCSLTPPEQLPKGFQTITLPDGQRIEGYHSEEYLQKRFDQFPIKTKWFRGKAVLDVGAAEGYFSFAFEACGANVTALDVGPNEVFLHFHRQSKSRVQYSMRLLDELTDTELTSFELVLMAGVLEILPSPVNALHRVLTSMQSGAVIVAAGPSGFVRARNDYPVIEVFQRETDPPFQHRFSLDLFEMLSAKTQVEKTFVYDSESPDEAIVVFCLDMATTANLDLSQYTEIYSRPN